MTNKSRLGTLIAAGIAISTVGAHAQAMVPDPNFGSATSGEEMLLASTPDDGRRFAVSTDPNLGASIGRDDAEGASSSPDARRIAVAPDANLGGPTSDELPATASRNSVATGSAHSMAH